MKIEHATKLDNLFVSWTKLAKKEAYALPSYNSRDKDSILEFTEWLEKSESKHILFDYLRECIYSKDCAYLIKASISVEKLLFDYVEKLALNRFIESNRWRRYNHTTPLTISKSNETIKFVFKNQEYLILLPEFLGLTDEGVLRYWSIDSKPPSR
jgi:hypothetical protein